jgi:uncharacterized protein (DUF849 family)
MPLEDPVNITCASSGALASREQSPATPCTPEENASESAAVKA